MEKEELEKMMDEMVNDLWKNNCKSMKKDIWFGTKVFVLGIVIFSTSFIVPSDLFNLIATGGLGIVAMGGIMIVISSVALWKSYNKIKRMSP